MLLAAPLKCVCGCKPKLGKGNYNYVRYYCPNCGMGTFHHRLEELAREAWNAQIQNVDKLKVRI